ncbi:MAG TPA: ATP-binding protein [Halomicronema sp.]
MPSIHQVILKAVNPFDPTTFTPGNFWRENQDAAQTLESIHQEAITEIEALLDLVATNHRRHTVLLSGDSGSGKSYLLGRLKRKLNPKAFFAYIGPWPDSDYIWRHILRYTVDSLMQVPEGQKESQLMLWLKGLSVFTKSDIKKKIFNEPVWDALKSDRQKFIQHLKKTYDKKSIYNADFFFGVLHDLTNPDLESLAYEWLQGNDLSEESLKALKVKSSIETEIAAKEILSNLGRISSETQPIVLCFDNLDNIPKNEKGLPDLQALFDVNSMIHTEELKNFLMIISILTNYWKEYEQNLQPSDKQRINTEIQLRDINLEQAEKLLEDRLYPLHIQAAPKPESPIFPISEQALEIKFPQGKTKPRDTLILGGQLFEAYKQKVIAHLGVKAKVPDPVKPPTPKAKTLAAFQLLWQAEYNKTLAKIPKISFFATPEMLVMLQEALSALGVTAIQPKLFGGKLFSGYGFSYQLPTLPERIGIVWTEDLNKTNFYHVMSACQKAIEAKTCEKLYLIRAASVGTPALKGNQIYSQVFTGAPHKHIIPSLTDVHYLDTYHSLVNNALAKDLVIDGKVIELEELQTLMRDSQIFNKLSLFKDLDILPGAPNPPGTKPPAAPDEEIKNWALNFIKVHKFLGRQILIQNAINQFPKANAHQINQVIEQLIKENKIKILDPKAAVKSQTICWIP